MIRSYIHSPLTEKEVLSINNIWLLPKKFPIGSKVQILEKGTLSKYQQMMVGSVGIVAGVDIIHGWITIRQQRSSDGFMETEFYDFQLKKI